MLAIDDDGFDNDNDEAGDVLRQTRHRQIRGQSRTTTIRMSMTDCSFFWLQISTVAGVSGVPSHAAQFHAVVG